MSAKNRTGELREKIQTLEFDFGFLTDEEADLILKACKEKGLAFVGEVGITVGISCGRSTDYVDEYWIEDAAGNHIYATDFPLNLCKKLFKPIEEIKIDELC